MTATASPSRVNRPPVPGGPDARSGLLGPVAPLRRLWKVDAVRRVLLRRAADPHAEQEPAATGDLDRRALRGEDGLMAVHDVDHERADRDPARLRRGHRENRPVLDNRHGPVALAN